MFSTLDLVCDIVIGLMTGSSELMAWIILVGAAVWGLSEAIRMIRHQAITKKVQAIMDRENNLYLKNDCGSYDTRQCDACKDCPYWTDNRDME